MCIGGRGAPYVEVGGSSTWIHHGQARLSPLSSSKWRFDPGPIHTIPLHLLCSTSALPLHQLCNSAPAPLHLLLCTCTITYTIMISVEPQHLLLSASAPYCTSALPLYHLFTTSALPLPLHYLYLCITSALPHLHLHYLCTTSAPLLHLCTSDAPLHLCTFALLHLCTTSALAPPLHYLCTTSAPLHLCT